MDALIPLSYWLRILIGLETIIIILKSHLNLMPFILTRENMINEEYIKFFKGGVYNSNIKIGDNAYTHLTVIISSQVFT